MADRPIQPKTPVTAEVTLFGGQKVTGEFFVAKISRRGEGAETLFELVNDMSRSFVPFQTEDGIFLLNRSTVRTIEFQSAQSGDVFQTPDSGFIYPLSITLRTEMLEVMLEGSCFTGTLPITGRRPVDLLNTPEMFLLLYQKGKLTLVNKNAISHVVV